MEKLALYTIFILSYVFFEKQFFPEDYGTLYIKNLQEVSPLIEGEPASVVLVNIHRKGLLFKTYYLRLRVITTNSSPIDYIVRTSRRVAEQNNKYIGMSIYQRLSTGESKFTPSIPGSVFIANDSLGKWVKDNDQVVWDFYKAYEFLTDELQWGAFQPTLQDYTEIQNSYKNYKPYHGANHEFGTSGSITQKSMQYLGLGSQSIRRGLIENFKNYLQVNYKGES